MYALDAATGRTRWQFGTGAGVYSTPVVDDDRVYFGSDDGFVYALSSRPGPTPRLAVYWDDAAMAVSNLGANDRHRRIPEHFARHGYEQLDTLTVVSFLEARLRDQTPSAVVFAMDYLPGALAGGADGLERSLFRRYLEAGGKIVWLSTPPLAFVRDPESGQFAGVDRERPTALLGVDHRGWNSDVYPVRITVAGANWGLEGSWLAGPVARAEDVSEVLAEDEKRRPVAWVRSYGGAPGTGFVHLRPSFDRAILEEIRRVVEHGIFYGTDG